MRWRKDNESGLTLVETMIAMLILLFALVSLAQLFGLAIVLNKNQGRDATNAAAFAHDKMEELNSLLVTDTTTNVTVDVFPFPATGKGLSPGGSIPPAAPAADYSDYVDQNGARTTAANAAFTRQWQITAEPLGHKKITLAVTSNRSFNYGTAPAVLAVTFKTQ